MNALIIQIAPQIAFIIVAIVTYICHIIFVHIPAQQRVYIEQWAKVAVLQAEQFGAGKTNAEKKQMAMDAITKLFSTFNLPLLPSDILSAFIEAAVNMLPSTNAVAKPDSTLQGGQPTV